MRIAAFADVHGNAAALRAVLEDLAPLRPDLLVNLGDLVSGPFDPAGSAALQMALDCPTLGGNHERQLLAGLEGASDRFARPLLSTDQLNWIGALPPTLRLLDGEVFACHGSPAGGDTASLLEDVSTGHPALAPETAIRAGLAGIGAARLVLCAHTHIPRVVTMGDVLVVNPGSVGLPAYSDERPVPHRMESGSSHARYALLDRGSSGWQVQLRHVGYDAEAAARQAERNDRPEVAYAVRTGRVPPPTG